MQITPAAAKDIERQSGGTTFKLEDLSDPEINIRYGTFYLRELLDRYEGDEAAALAAYNAGPGNADRWGGGVLTSTTSPSQTRAYVEEVLEKPRTTGRSTRRSWAIERGALSAPSPEPRVAALALAVGLVLADSSIVVLALPDIYRELDTSVAGVTWVLVSFNLVMALAAVPAALVARRVGPGRAAAVGLAIFAGAGLACGLADQLSTLIVARCVQALGGAAAVTAALELLPASVGSERRAAAIWASAGATGAALGPAVGGILTQLVSWQSIFLLQVPLAIAAAVPILAVARHEAATGILEPELRRTGRPHLLANLALAMVSAAIAAALFLLVLLLIEGWRLSPIGAAIVVSVMPLAALAGSRLGRARPQRPGARRGRRDPRLRRPRRAGAAAQGGGRADPAAPDPGRGRALAGPLGADRDRAARAGAAGDPRRLDDLRPPRRRRHRAAGADADLHRRHRQAAPRRDQRRHRGRARLEGRTAAEDPARPAHSGPHRRRRRGRCRRSAPPSNRCRATPPKGRKCSSFAANFRTSSTAAPPTPSAPPSCSAPCWACWR